MIFKNLLRRKGRTLLTVLGIGIGVGVAALEFQAQILHIFPQCLATLIHKPLLLVGKLPGAENLAAHEH